MGVESREFVSIAARFTPRAIATNSIHHKAISKIWLSPLIKKRLIYDSAIGLASEISLRPTKFCDFLQQHHNIMWVDPNVGQVS